MDLGTDQTHTSNPPEATNFKESKLPKGLSAMVPFVKKDLYMDLETDQRYISTPPEATNFKEFNLPKGLSAMVSYVKYI